MRISRKGAITLTAVLAAGFVSADSYGAVMSYTSKNSASSSYSRKYDEEYDEEDDEGYGPGYVSKESEKYLDEEEETDEFEGPGVNKVSLREQYHEDYKIYEESIADLFFLYTSVANGGMTDKAVTIDIPSNILYTMEKDGTGIAYTSGQSIQERGTYVLRLIAVENPELPLSEQTEYQAVFRFRIQDKPPVEKEEAETVFGWNDSSVYAGLNEPEIVYVEEPEEIYEYEWEESTEESEFPEEEIEETAEESTEEITDEIIEETTEESLEETKNPEETLEEETDEDQTKVQGPEVTVTIKGGGAQIEYPSEDIEEIILEKDGEVVEGFHGTRITEPGKYRLTVKDSEGNTTVQEFALKYRMNGYGIMAIVLSIAVIAGIAAFVMYTKKNMKIR